MVKKRSEMFRTCIEEVRSNIDGQNRVSSMFGFLVCHAGGVIVTQLYFCCLIVRILPSWSGPLAS